MLGIKQHLILIGSFILSLTTTPVHGSHGPGIGLEFSDKGFYTITQEKVLTYIFNYILHFEMDAINIKGLRLFDSDIYIDEPPFSETSITVDHDSPI